jgi:hypothetical protein
VTAPIGVIIGRPVISGSKKAPVVEVPMAEGESAMAKAAAMEHVAAAEGPAVKDVTTAPAAAETHAMTTAAEMHAAAVTASAAMAAHFGDQSVGDGFCGGRGARTDRRQRVRGLA